jgi:hypothetical protein
MNNIFVDFDTKLECHWKQGDKILEESFKQIDLNRKKRIIIENIKDLEYQERITILQELIDMFKSEMLIFGESK